MFTDCQKTKMWSHNKCQCTKMYYSDVKTRMDFVFVLFLFLDNTHDCFNLSSYDYRVTILRVLLSKENEKSFVSSRCTFIANILLFFSFVQIRRKKKEMPKALLVDMTRDDQISC